MIRATPVLICVLILAAIVVTGCSGQGPAADVDPAAMVREIADEAWQYRLDRSSYLRLREGLPITELEDITPEAQAEDVAFAEHILERLAEVPRDALAEQDLVTSEIL